MSSALAGLTAAMATTANKSRAIRRISNPQRQLADHRGRPTHYTVEVPHPYSGVDARRLAAATQVFARVGRITVDTCRRTA
jgi:hypothetical protein